VLSVRKRERESARDTEAASSLPAVALNNAMIRPVLTELALFLAPFAVYAIFLWATQADLLHPESWPLPRLMWLTIAALALMFGSFVVLAQWGGEPKNSPYVPAHIENGKLVPGTTK
jgi:heme/copper-type cytochrome/quinol oxidase subunit 3